MDASFYTQPNLKQVGSLGWLSTGTPDPKGSSSTGSERGESAVRGHLRLTRLSDVGSRANRWRGSPAPDQ